MRNALIALLDELKTMRLAVITISAVAVTFGVLSGYPRGLSVAALVYELAGAVLLARPALAHWGGEQRERAAAARARAVLTVRRWLRRPRPPQHHELSGSGRITLGGRARLSATVGLKRDATLEEKVDFLIERERVHQDRWNDLRRDLEDLPGRWRADDTALGDELRGTLEELRANLRDAEEQRIPVEVTGVFFVVVGVILATLGSVLPE